MQLARLLLLAATTLAVGGCVVAPPGPRYGNAGYSMGEEEIRRGVVTRIDPVELERSHQTGLGAVLGAAAGGVVGSQFGGGGGRDVAAVLGLIGGGIAGNRVEESYAQRRPGQHVFVRLSNGVTVAVTQAADPSLREGDPVLVEGYGQGARVVRR